MVYHAALVTLTELLEDIINRDQYPNFIFGKQPIMKSLHEKFRFLEELLQDYSSKGNEDADYVEGRIRAVACKAQDIIESEITNQIESKRETRKRFLILDLKYIEKEIYLIVDKLQVEIKERRRHNDLQLNCDFVGIEESAKAPNCKNIMVGFDEYLATIKEQLCGQSSKLQVIPITGTGGIGKTTLARNIFGDTLVKYHFDFRAWAPISQCYNVKVTLHSILKSMGLRVVEPSGEEESVLKERTYKYLKGKRYLVVIDDIWTTEVWDDLRCIFTDDCNGSRIVLTTRLLDIGQYTSTSGIVHQVKFLNDEDSWILLRERVFEHDCCPPELEVIGNSIARKCYGLPLAIVVIAGVLSNSRQPHEWKKIAVRTSSILSQTNERFSRIICLSYNHLPQKLKACFLYMGCFPEDHEICVSNLIKLWVAEGFVQSTNESKSLEDAAEECLEDVKRNLVIVSEKRVSGRFKFCVLHDLLRDFCIHKAILQHFYAMNHVNGFSHPTWIENARRFNVHGNFSMQTYPFGPSERTRSLLWFAKFYKLSNLYQIEDFKLLRVLGVQNTACRSIPDAISQMYHLRYLCLYVDKRVIHLSPSICKVQNLQTIIISASQFCSLVLPPQIWKMTQLRHLIIGGMTLPCIPLASDVVVKLEIFQMPMRVHDFRFTNEVIEVIPNLRKLKTSYTSCAIRKWDHYHINNLTRLLDLEELKITFISMSCHVCVESSVIPRDITFPLNLRKLSLYGCGFPWKYMTVVGSLPNLQVLKLINDPFEGPEWEPIEGEFGQLKFLHLELLDLKSWEADSTHFPRLEHLKISKCFELEKVPLEVGDIPTLKSIHVCGGRGVEDSAIQIREEQQNLGNDVLQVLVGYV